MTDVKPNVDLRPLTREREAPRRPRRFLKFVIPLAILAAFGAILATSFRDLFEKTVDVTTIRPKPATDESGNAVAAGNIALQAAGWVEPEPFPIRVSALASGVVKEMVVREADHVNAGDPIARLIDEDARLFLEKAEGALGEANAERERARVEDEFAKKSFDAALAVDENAAAMRALADGRIAESRHRAQAVAGGESDLKVADEELEIQRRLAKEGAAGPRAVELAAAKVRSAAAALEILKANAALAASQAQEAETRAYRAKRDQELRLDEKLRVAAARAALASADAKVRTADAVRKEAALRLERMTIRSPAAGIVMERVAAPGVVLHADDPDHSTACLLFDPASLRIRVDVSQTDIAKVSVGQKTEIQSQARRQNPYRGEVLRIVERADIQKVTLQVHVRVLEGDALLRPEMLCHVRFLGEGAPASAPTGRAPAPGLLVPARVLVNDKFVWTLDPETARARKRLVEVGSRSGEWVLIRSGLNITDKVIDLGRDQLEDGTRVRARGGE